jgi:CRP-like cAMP-binding protein
VGDADRDAVREHLEKIPLFSRLDAQALDAIAEIAVPFDCEAGYILVQPGMVGAGLFVIEDGCVTLTVHNHEVELGPGEMVGELAILDDRAVHTTRVRTKTPVNGYCISRDAFEDLLKRAPSIAVPMLKVLAHRLVDTVERH